MIRAQVSQRCGIFLGELRDDDRMLRVEALAAGFFQPGHELGAGALAREVLGLGYVVERFAVVLQVHRQFVVDLHQYHLPLVPGGALDGLGLNVLDETGHAAVAIGPGIRHAQYQQHQQGRSGKPFLPTRPARRFFRQPLTHPPGRQ